MRPAKIKPINIHQLSEKGKEIYQSLKATLEPEHKGEYLVIEVESGDYFIGETIGKARKKAQKKYPEKVFYLIKIGYPGVFNLSTFASSQSL